MFGLHGLEVVIFLFAAMLLLATLAQRLTVPYPIVLVIGGLILGFVPGLPPVRLDPDLVFLVFLPPILWAAAYFTSFREFRANLRPITLLAVGLVLATTAAVAVVAHAVVPGLGWAGAIALGAIVSPPDAVAAAAVLHRLKIPRRVVTILEGESLVNDASALILYRAAVVALVTGEFHVSLSVAQFFVGGIGGIAIGLAVGALAMAAMLRVRDSLIEIAITLLAPYIAWTLGERLHVSAVLACVAGGLLMRRGFSHAVAPATRLQARAVWDLLIFALNGVIFILIGLQLPALAGAVRPGELSRLIWQGLLIAGAAIVVRLLWVPVATWLPRVLSRRLRARDPLPPWRAVFLIGWTAMRGIVSLAAALALPLTTADGRPLPFREQIILLSFVVIVTTLLLQGLSLPALIRVLRFPEDTAHRQEEAQAREAAVRAGQGRLSELTAFQGAHEEPFDALRRHYDERSRRVAELRADVAPSSSLAEAAFKRARYETLAAERRALIALRDEGSISDEVLLELERELDLEAARHGLAEIRLPRGGAAPAM